MSRLLEADALLTLHCGLAFFMAGLIWFVQVVHYPLFAAVGSGQFAAYEKLHVRRVSWVVGPAMVLEAITALALLLAVPSSISRGALAANAMLLALTWLSTIMWQAPGHAVLLRGFDADTARRLVATNWVRTVCWTLRSLLLLACCVVSSPSATS